MDLNKSAQIYVEEWIKDVERVEGYVTNISKMHNSCISIKFKSGKAYKLSFALSSNATLS